MTATYSPEDNKLRLRAVGRLPRELYERVRGAGFIWAPKQDLFVAPMWTPAREDLLLELCGEIGDEDTSLVERAEQRAERFEDYSASRKDDAESARKAVASIADGIPLGQPILVGHHSERRARKDAEKIENGMRRAVKMWETSTYWADRARGAIRAAKYKERPDVRARRIKGIEAAKRKEERNKATSENALKLWARPMTREEALHLAGCTSEGHLGCARREGGAEWERWSAYDVLQPDDRRYKDCPAWTVEQCRERANNVYPANIAHYNRWIAHYDNRLAYERAMLAEDGGTVADKTGPEKGGGCRCWASPRGGWSNIVKVNKVSVTVHDNWGNGGENFTRTIPFDKLAAVMSKADVDAHREAGRLVEAADKTGFYVREDAPAATVPTLRAPGWQEREHAARQAATTDSKPDEDFRAMRETLKQGVQVVTAPQLFPTPAAIADRMVELADIQPGQEVLEPSAGTGAIIDAIRRKPNHGCAITAVEINSGLAERLRTFDYLGGYRVRCADFLTCNGNLGLFERVLMNPPFENASDIRHIKHALRFLKPGGRLVAICANGPRQQEQLRPLAEANGGEWIELEPGAFESSGTSVRAALLVIHAAD